LNDEHASIQKKLISFVCLFYFHFLKMVPHNSQLDKEKASLKEVKTYFVSMVVGVRCAVRVEWRFSCDEIHRITTKTALLFKRECKIYIEATQASVSPNDVRRLSSYEQSLESRTSIYETDIIAQEE
ncbi:hypothetical protein T10_5653, partial [Trichinella papuae]